MKAIKNQRSQVPFMLFGKILAQWWHPVASSEGLDLLIHWAMRAISYRSIIMAIKMASKVGVFVDCFCLPVALAAAGAVRSN
jgi:hypothetical protein